MIMDMRGVKSVGGDSWNFDSYTVLSKVLTSTAVPELEFGK